MEIDYVFGIGRRCNTTEFIRNNNLSTFASPFDYMFSDLESSLYNISTDFKFFLTNIVFCNKNKQVKILLNNEDSINNEFFNRLQYKNLSYLSNNYNHKDIFVNQNFLPSNITGDLCQWDTINCFIHHNLLDEKIYNDISNRCTRMTGTLQNSNCLLIYFSPIVGNAKYERVKYIKLVDKYNIKTNVFIVLFTCVNKLLGYFRYNNVHFYSMLVPNLNSQYNLIEDNPLRNINTTEILNVINLYFKFKSIN